MSFTYIKGAETLNSLFVLWLNASRDTIEHDEEIWEKCISQMSELEPDQGAKARGRTLHLSPRLHHPVAFHLPYEIHAGLGLGKGCHLKTSAVCILMQFAALSCFRKTV